jgi:hypothetical protein
MWIKRKNQLLKVVKNCHVFEISLVPKITNYQNLKLILQKIYTFCSKK